MEVKISAVIICFNEERNIERCINSVLPVADEVLVLDSFSTDRTIEICKKFGVRLEQHAFDGHIEQKNRAMKMAKHHVVLSLDADEALTETLQNSILFVKKNWQQKAYKFNRKTNYCGQWINHCGWYPDTKIRLWDKRIGEWGGYNPHDKVELQKGVEAKWLDGDLTHYSFYTVNEHKQKVERYSTIKAKAVFKRGKTSGLFKIMAAPTFKFFWSYVVRMGFLDGAAGFTICRLSALESKLTYQKIRRLQLAKEQ
ncbi:MAG: glycosyltransferase family 2 protein [Bacteroidia bacterium]